MSKRNGVTLLELLVAMALATIVSYFAYDLLRDESGHYIRTREKIKVQADARDAMRILEAEIRNTGFGARASTNRIANAAERCSQVWFDTVTGAAIRPTNNSTTISTGDQIVIRSMLLGSSGQLATTCGTGAGSLFQEIGYRLNGGSLERYFRQDTSATPVWVPFLNDVVSFQVQYGLAATPNTFIGVPATIMNIGNWASSGGTVASCGAGCVNLQGWSATASRTWGTTMAGFNVKRGETYKLGFTFDGNLGFLDSNATGTVTGYNRPRLFVGILESLTGKFIDSINVWAGDQLVPDPAPREIYLTMPTNGTSVRFAVRGRLKTGATVSTPAQELWIRNVSIELVNSGTYLSWIDNPTSAQLGETKAVRVTLLTKTQDRNREGVKATYTGAELGDPALPSYTASGADTTRSHVLLQRIIPVVNNGR